jgi:vitamin B12 transporter
VIGVFLYPKIDMKKIFSIIALSLSTLGFGQEVLDSITVAINRASSPFNEAMREVNVITQSEIEKAPLETINEMLEYSSGVDVRQRGGFDIQSDVSVRGGTFEQTLILLNGMKMNDPQTGHHNMNLPISYDLIEQVEVLQGGASRVYGPNAFAGAINFRTRRDGETMLGARMMGGQYGLFQAAVYGALKGKKHYTLIS